MALNLNQFKLTQIAGEVMNPAANVIQASVLSTLAAASYYVAGQVMAFGTATNDMPTVRAVASGCGVGVIVFNAKSNKYYANDIVGLAIDGSIITMTVASAVMRGDIVAWGTTALGTITSGNGIGMALDIETTGTGIVRVLVKAGVAASGITWY